MTKSNPYVVVRRRPDKPYGYDASCRLCPYTSEAWDWRGNALSHIRTHVSVRHGKKQL